MSFWCFKGNGIEFIIIKIEFEIQMVRGIGCLPTMPTKINQVPFYLSFVLKAEKNIVQCLVYVFKDKNKANFLFWITFKRKGMGRKLEINKLVKWATK